MSESWFDEGLRWLGERGEPRGAAAVYRDAVAHAPVVELEPWVPTPPNAQRHGLLLTTVAAALLLALFTGWWVVGARARPAPTQQDIVGADLVTTTVTPPPPTESTTAPVGPPASGLGPPDSAVGPLTTEVPPAPTVPGPAASSPGKDGPSNPTGPSASVPVPAGPGPAAPVPTTPPTTPAPQQAGCLLSTLCEITRAGVPTMKLPNPPVGYSLVPNTETRNGATILTYVSKANVPVPGGSGPSKITLTLYYNPDLANYEWNSLTQYTQSTLPGGRPIRIVDYTLPAGATTAAMSHLYLRLGSPLLVADGEGVTSDTLKQAVASVVIL